MSLSVENIQVEQLTHSPWNSTELSLLQEVFHNTKKNFFSGKSKGMSKQHAHSKILSLQAKYTSSDLFIHMKNQNKPVIRN